MDRKIIFLDIDGTLTEPGSNEPPVSALQAVRGAQKKGYYVCLCTGRNYEMLSPLLKFGFDGVIASSGGYIVFKDEVIYDCPMTEAQRETALNVLRKMGFFGQSSVRTAHIRMRGLRNFCGKMPIRAETANFLRWREQIEHSLHILPMNEYRGQPIYKIVMMCQSPKQLEEPRQMLGEDFEFCIQDADQYGIINGELVNRKFDKGKGIERICQHLNIPVNDTIAFGDSMNDKEMMETAGISLCMENGSESLKKLADDICPSVRDNGLYQGFVKYGLV